MEPETMLERARAGGEWLINKQDPDGGWSGLADPKLDGFYKSGWTLSQMGHSSEAHKLLTYVEEEFMTQAGDFECRESDVLSQVQHLYPNAYLIAGAQSVARYDISMLARRYLLTRQDPAHGGFYSQRRVPGEESRTNSMTTAAAGMGALAAGSLSAATQAGEFLESLVDRQPDPKGRFFTTLDADGSLLTNIEDEEYDWWLEISTSEPNQCWYAVGLPFAFLVELAQATGKGRFLELAEWFFDFQEQCIEPWTGGSSGKAGWGCSMLYRQRGDKKYQEAANQVAEYLISRQGEDGGWLPQSADPGDEISNTHFDTTAEFSLWLKLMGDNLLARRRTQ